MFPVVDICKFKEDKKIIAVPADCCIRVMGVCPVTDAGTNGSHTGLIFKKHVFTN